MGELNRKNRQPPYSLSWDPKAGIVARTYVAAESAQAGLILNALQRLWKARAKERFKSLD